MPSLEPETICLRFGLKKTELTASLWPLKLRLRAGSASLFFSISFSTSMLPLFLAPDGKADYFIISNLNN